MAKQPIHVFDKATSKRLVDELLNSKREPPPSLSGHRTQSLRLQNNLRGAIAQEDINTQLGSGTGLIAFLDNEKNPLVDGDVEAHNIYCTTIWQNAPCAALRVKGQWRIVQAFSATELLCTADSLVTPGTSSFNGTVVAELDGYYGKASVVAENVFELTLQAGDPFEAIWDEDNLRWIALAPGFGTGTSGTTPIPGCGLLEELIDEMSVWKVKPSDLAGKGLIPATGTETSECAIDFNPGCGLEFGTGGNSDKVQVNPNDIAGPGLYEYSECELGVQVGCGLLINGDFVEVDPSDLVGDGLIVQTGTVPSTCAIAVNPGCGIHILEDKVTVNYGEGLTCIDGVLEATGTTLQPGCGTVIQGGVIYIDDFALAGDGLSASAGTDDCYLNVEVGCGLQLVGTSPDKVVAVNPSDLVGTASITGLEVPSGSPGSDCAIAVDLTPVATFTSHRIDSCTLGLETHTGATWLRVTTLFTPLTIGVNAAGDVISASYGAQDAEYCETMLEPCPTGGGGTTYTAGCGIDINGSNVISVDNVDLAGAGLVAGVGCALDIGAGCGISVSADSIAVDAAQLAGAGLFVSAGCTLAIGAGNGITVNANDITVKEGAGLTFSSGFLVVGQGLGILVNENDIQVRAGAGLTFSANDLVVGAGCGISVGTDTVSVDGLQLAGAGLFISSGCTLAVGAGCGISVAADAISVDHTALAGNGLAAGINCQLDINAGCGLEVVADQLRFKNTDVAGSGLVVSGICALNVGAGCGISTSSNAVSVDRAQLMGQGLEADLGACEIKVKLGSCLTFDISDAITLDGATAAGAGLTASGCVLAVGAGCGISVAADSVAVDAAQLAGSGLLVSSGCTLAVGAGCGISVAADAVAVDAAQLAGAGLFVSSGCTLAIGAGCGVTVNANDIAVDATQLAGAGLVVSAGCTLAVNPGCGLEIVTDVLQVKYGAGLDCVDGTLIATGTTLTEGCGIDITGNVISFDPVPVAGSGLSAGGGCSININVSCGLEIFSDAVRVKASDLAGSGLVVSGTCQLNVGAGCGITVSADTISVNHTALAGDGLVAGVNCQLNVNAGCGLQILTDQLQVKPSDLAGSGLVPGAACRLDVNVGCGLEIISDQVRVKASDLAGAGLTQSGICTLDIGAGCGITVAANNISIDRAALLGQGLEAGAGSCDIKLKVDTCFTFDGTGALSLVHANLAGSGLSAGGGCSINVNVGCGLQIITDQVRVNRTDLIGQGLEADSGTCDIKVKTGCGLTFGIDDELKVDGPTMAGIGLVASPDCTLSVNAGCGLILDAVLDQVRVNRNDLIAANGGLEAGGGTCNLKVKAGCGITVVSSGVQVNPGTASGIDCVGGLVVAKVGCGLDFDVSGNIVIDRNDLFGVNSGLEGGGSTCDLQVKAGCGITVDASGVNVNAGAGLVCSGGAVNVGAGCGITVNADTIQVKNTDLAGVGLSPGGGCSLNVNAGCGLEIISDQVRIKTSDLIGLSAGASGLTTNGTCGFKVDNTPAGVPCTFKSFESCELELIGTPTNKLRLTISTRTVTLNKNAYGDVIGCTVGAVQEEAPCEVDVEACP